MILAVETTKLMQVIGKPKQFPKIRPIGCSWKPLDIDRYILDELNTVTRSDVGTGGGKAWDHAVDLSEYQMGALFDKL